LRKNRGYNRLCYKKLTNTKTNTTRNPKIKFLAECPPKPRESAWKANRASLKVSAFFDYQDNIALNKVAKAELATKAPSRI